MRRAILVSLLGSPLLLIAQIQLTPAGQHFAIDFDSAQIEVVTDRFMGTGFSPNPSAGQLDSDSWRISGLSDGSGQFGQSYTSGDFARGDTTGGVGFGGTYAFDLDSSSMRDMALGMQPSIHDWTPGHVFLRVLNTTGHTLQTAVVMWTGCAYNDQPRGNLLYFTYSSNDTTYFSPSSNSLLSDSTAAAIPAWECQTFSHVLPNLGIPDSSYLYLRWSGRDSTGSGHRDEFALDDITYTTVELLSLFQFTAERNGSHIRLQWSTLHKDATLVASNGEESQQWNIPKGQSQKVIADTTMEFFKLVVGSDIYYASIPRARWLMPKSLRSFNPIGQAVESNRIFLGWSLN